MSLGSRLQPQPVVDLAIVRPDTHIVNLLTPKNLQILKRNLDVGVCGLQMAQARKPHPREALEAAIHIRDLAYPCPWRESRRPELANPEDADP